MRPRRSIAAFVLAALAVLGILRLPCVLAAATASLRSQAAELPPCHGAPAAPEEQPPTGCSQCASLHSLVGPASAVAAPGTAPATLLVAAPAPRLLAARSGGLTLSRVGSARAPDPLRTSTVRLL